MLSFLEKFKTVDKSSTKASEEEKNILIASLLIECAKEDGNFSQDEVIKIKNLLISKLNVKDENLNNMFDRALEITQDSVEIYSLTKEIERQFFT